MKAFDRLLRWLPVATAIVLFLLLTVRPIQDYDLWWHLRTGAYILENGLPTNDVLTHTATDHHWVVPDWLCDILMYEVNRAGGVAGLTLLKVAVFLGAFLVLLRVCRLRGVSPVTAGVTLVLVVLIARVRFLERPLMFKFLFGGLWIWALESYRLTGRRWFWWLLPLQVAWENMHSSWIVGPALPCVYAASLWLEGWLLRREGARSPWPIAAFAAACVAACLVDPRGPSTLVYPFRLASSKVLREMTDELAPLMDLPLSTHLALWGAIATMAAAWVFASARGTIRGPLCDIAVSVPFAYLAWNSRRFIGLWSYLAAPAVAFHLSALARLLQARSPALVARAWRAVAVLPAVVAVALFLWPRGLPSIRLEVGVDRDVLPVASVEYLSHRGLQGKAYNTFEFGGIIEWECPRVKPYIDGRGMVFGDPFIADFMGLSGGGPRWEEAQRRTGVTIGVISLSNGPEIPYRQFFPRPAWRLVEWDDIAAVYLRDVPANEKAIREDAYEVIDPVEEAPDYAPSDALAKDLNRCLTRHPRCFRALCVRGLLEFKTGRTDAAIQTLEGVVQAKPSWSTPCVQLARAYLQVGRNEDAKRILERLHSRGAITQDSIELLWKLEQAGY